MVKTDPISKAVTVIIPAAGQSTRFPGRPKFLWTHPLGSPMFNMSTYGLSRDIIPARKSKAAPTGIENLDGAGQVCTKPFILTVLEEHEEKYKFKAHVEKLYHVKVHVIKKSDCIEARGDSTRNILVRDGNNSG